MTDLFIQNILSISRSSIPPQVWRQAERTLIDYFAVTVSGSKYFHEKLASYAEGIKESGNSTIIGLGIKSSKQTAALLNGMSAHVLELDDGHRKGAIHVGATVYSALLAIAEDEGFSVEDILFGGIIGYEVTVRLACAVQPGNKLRGYHATGTCGTVGAAMGIAAAMGQDFEQMKSSFSAAVTSAGGVLEMQENNADMKPFNVGRAAMDAVSAAYMGKARFKAPDDALGGRRGFLKIMTDTPSPAFLSEAVHADNLAIMRIYMKTYASCRHAHPAIEAAMILCAEHPELSSNNIRSIVIETYKLAVSGHDHTEIAGVSSAKMSIPFCVALAICRGDAGMSSFTEENVADKTILSLTKKVKVIENEQLSILVPDKRASLLHILTSDGKEFTQRVDYPKGEPENPLTDDELRHKFVSLVTAGGLSKESCETIINNIYNHSSEIKTIVSLLR